MYLVKLVPADRPLNVDSGEFDVLTSDGVFIASPDYEGTAVLLSLGIDGNMVASEVLADDPEEWRTRLEVLNDIQDYPHQTEECKTFCDEIRVKFERLEA